MNEFQENVADTVERTLSERHMEAVRQQGGMFVEAVRVTRMPMLVTDAGLPGNPIIFANRAFVQLSGYTEDELLGQDPHFMNANGLILKPFGSTRARSRPVGTRRWRSCNTERTERPSGPCSSPVRWTMARGR